MLLGCADPGSAPDHPTWPLRNALLLAARAMGLQRVRVVCARARSGRPSPAASLLLDVCLPEVPPGALPPPSCTASCQIPMCRASFDHILDVPDRLRKGPCTLLQAAASS